MTGHTDWKEWSCARLIYLYTSLFSSLPRKFLGPLSLDWPNSQRPAIHIQRDRFFWVISYVLYDMTQNPSFESYHTISRDWMAWLQKCLVESGRDRDKYNHITGSGNAWEFLETPTDPDFLLFRVRICCDVTQSAVLAFFHNARIFNFILRVIPNFRACAVTGRHLDAFSVRESVLLRQKLEFTYWTNNSNGSVNLYNLCKNSTQYERKH